MLLRLACKFNKEQDMLIAEKRADMQTGLLIRFHSYLLERHERMSHAKR